MSAIGRRIEDVRRNKTMVFLIARAGQMNRGQLGGLLVRSLPKFVALSFQTLAPFAYCISSPGGASGCCSALIDRHLFLAPQLHRAV